MTRAEMGQYCLLQWDVSGTFTQIVLTLPTGNHSPIQPALSRECVPLYPSVFPSCQPEIQPFLSALPLTSWEFQSGSASHMALCFQPQNFFLHMLPSSNMYQNGQGLLFSPFRLYIMDVSICPHHTKREDPI